MFRVKVQILPKISAKMKRLVTSGKDFSTFENLPLKNHSPGITGIVFEERERMSWKKISPFDLVNASVAGMRDGVGPLLTLFLVQKTTWDSAQLGWILAVPSLAALLSQIPVGIIYDRVADKRWCLIFGAFLMGGASLIMSQTPSYILMLVLQWIAGLATCFLSVGIPALSVSLVPLEILGQRFTRNEVFSKIGNFSAIAFTGYVAQRLSLLWVFYSVIVFASFVILSSLFVHVPNVSARSESVGPSAKNTELLLPKILRLLKTASFTKIVILATIFQFANASMLMVFEQSFARARTNGGAGPIATAIFFTQLIIIVASLLLTRKKGLKNPLKYFALGFLFIFLRGLTFTANFGLFSLAAAQIFDGCIAAILIIVPIQALAAMDQKNFNIMSGILGTAVALGASLSTILAGVLIKHSDFRSTYLVFTLAALVGLSFCAILARTAPSNLNSNVD